MSNTIRTNTHYYPVEEVTAMERFYGGKRCVYTLTQVAVDWSHQLDAALVSSTSRLDYMLKRGLRENRHPRHAAEVRENLVPVCKDLHNRSNNGVPSLTLFPHEDVLAQAFEYELALASLRQTEVDAGRPDPGRPSYATAYDVSDSIDSPFFCFLNEPVKGLEVPCRAHMPPDLDITYGLSSFQSATQPPIFYPPIQCPGVGVPGVDTIFPVVPTLLSLAFALLHQCPRLAAFSPTTSYQRDVLALGLEIIALWHFDPLILPGPHGVALPAPTTTTHGRTIFQSLGRVVDRLASFQLVLPRIGQGRGFRGCLGAPGPTDTDQPQLILAKTEEGMNDFDTDSRRSNSEGSGGSGGGEDPGRFIGATTNDTLMACGHMDPGVWLHWQCVPTALEYSATTTGSTGAPPPSPTAYAASTTSRSPSS
ncbi:hypothetical protein C8R43DRAFT_1240296 [Mycena crocata]|nr:hypothetical protein C8R43DRAFT_1240296 [Mycena crocata]